MEKITHEEFLEAERIVSLFKYQQDPKVEVSITYKGTIDCTVQVPEDWSIEDIKERFENGVPYHFSRDDEDNIKYGRIIGLIVDGEEIQLD